MVEHTAKKRKVLKADEARRAAELESLLFGGVTEREAEEDEGRALVEGAAGGGWAAAERGSGGQQAQAEEEAAVARKAVWEDEDDEGLRVDVAGKSRLRKLRHAEEDAVLGGRQYEQRLRQQHSKLNSRTSWAALGTGGGSGQPGGSSDDEGVQGLLQQAGGLLADSAVRLAPGLLETTRLRDGNQEEPCQSVVRSVEFHSNGQLLMTAGLDKRLRFFNVDGVRNPKVQSVFLEDMPLHKAAFAGGGTQVVAAGRRKFFYIFDLMAAKIERVAGLFGREERSFESFAASQGGDRLAFFGDQGHVPLVSLKSRQLAGTLKMNGSVRNGAFSADGSQLLTSGGDGVVYVWDLRMQRCLARWQDEGSLNGTSVACSPDGRLFACGSSSGVVNIYRQEPRPAAAEAGSWAAPEAPLAVKPLKTVLNLTTTVDTLAFNHDAQLLAIASRMKRDALRLLHVPSMTVFSNWPTSKSPLHYVHSVAFSPTSGYLAVGNARGRVLLYRLHAYPAV